MSRMKKESNYNYITFFLIFLTILISCLFVISNVKNQMKIDVYDNLHNLAFLNAEFVDFYIYKKIEVGEYIASEGTIVKDLKSIKTSNISLIGTEAMNNYLERKLNLDKDIYELILVDFNENIVINSKGNLNKNCMKNKNQFEEIKNLNFEKEKFTISPLFFDNSCNIYGIPFSFPIYHEGEFLGSLIMNVKAKTLNEFSISSEIFDQSGQVYVIDSNRNILTAVKTLSQGSSTPFLQEIDTINILECFDESIEGHGERKEPIHIFKDYRGVEVFGTHVETVNFGLCVLIEVETDILNVMGKNISTQILLIGFGIFIIIGGILGFGIWRKKN